MTRRYQGDFTLGLRKRVERGNFSPEEADGNHLGTMRGEPDRSGGRDGGGRGIRRKGGSVRGSGGGVPMI